MLSVLFSANVFSQNDVSLWGATNSDGYTNSFAWYSYSTESVYLEARWNFDQPNALGAFVGKPFSFGNHTVVPEIGVIYNDDSYIGISPEVTAWGSPVKNLDYFALGQYSYAAKGDDFLYGYLEVKYKVADFLKIGVATQDFYDFNEHFVDVGPLAVISIKNFYVKPGVNFRDGKFKKVYVGLGMSF